MFHPDEIIEYYSGIINANPDDAEAYFERARAYSLQEDYDAAGVDFDQAICLDPTKPIP